jgi:hypothetical protein
MNLDNAYVGLRYVVCFLFLWFSSPLCIAIIGTVAKAIAPNVEGFPQVKKRTEDKAVCVFDEKINIKFPEIVRKRQYKKDFHSEVLAQGIKHIKCHDLLHCF